MQRIVAPLEDYVVYFPVPEGQSGVVFAINDKVVGMELYDAPETFRKLFPKLMRSHGLDVLDRVGAFDLFLQILSRQAYYQSYYTALLQRRYAPK